MTLFHEKKNLRKIFLESLSDLKIFCFLSQGFCFVYATLNLGFAKLNKDTFNANSCCDLSVLSMIFFKYHPIEVYVAYS